MANTLSQMLATMFGIKTTNNESPAGFQVLAVVKQILSFNPNRLGLILINNSGSNLYVSFRNTVAVGAGIRLSANGGSLALKWDVDFELCGSEIYGIADGAGGNVYFNEIVALQSADRAV